MRTVILAEDHPIVRAGIKTVLEAGGVYRVVYETGDGDDILPHLERLKPEILLLDLDLPGKSGLDVLPLIPDFSPQTRAVVLSMHDAESYVVEAFRRGATGYLLKSSSPGMIKDALHEVLAGGRFASPPLRLEDVDRRLAGDAASHDGAALSAREQEVLALTMEGLSASQLAERLQISRRTVEKHRENLMRKLKADNVAELIRIATSQKLLLLGREALRGHDQARP